MNPLRTSLFWFSIATLTSVAAIAAPATADSRITAATVYADRAVISRHATLEIAAGETEVVFTNLPTQLLDNSVQVSARGIPATLLDVGTRVTHVENTADPRVKSLEDELAQLNRQSAALQDEVAVLDQQRAYLNKIENATTQHPAQDSTAPRPSVEEWQKLMTFSAGNAQRLANQRRELDQQQEELDRKISATQAQLNELRGRQPARRAIKTVTARFSATQAGKLDITLDYALTGAAWNPAYDARLRTEERAVELTYFGVVRNRTGEDWSNIDLTLSTARPNLGGGAPELDPWIVDVQRRPKRPDPSATVLGFNGSNLTLAQSERSMMNNLSVMPPPDSYAPVVDANLAVASLDNAATSASFKIPASATIPSDNTPQKVGIATLKLAAALQYQAAPRELETAFLSAYTVNSSDYPLLAGPVSTFLDNTFVATSRVKTVMPGEKLRLDLGADDGVAIKRKLVNRFTEDTGFTGKTRRVTYEFLITVTNHKRTAERVVFKDLLPVSRDEKIAVKLIAPSPKDTGTVDKPGREVTLEEDGKLVWRLDLQPGEKRESPFTFTIEHPADLDVTGVE